MASLVMVDNDDDVDVDDDDQALVKGESVFPAPGAKRLPTTTNCLFVIFTPLPCRHNLTIKDNQEGEKSNF